MISVDSENADEFSEDYFNFYDFTATVEDNKSPNENDDSSEELIEDLPRSIYCDLGSIFQLIIFNLLYNNHSLQQVTTLKERCNEHSILEIWKYDEEVIRGLKQQDIIDAVNSVDKRSVV